MKVVKSKRLRWTGHVKESSLKILTGQTVRKEPPVRPNVDGRSVLESILNK